jgi:hypothetical protein
VSIEANKLIGNVEQYWLKIREGNSKAANAKERANRKLVEQWTKDGCVLDVLCPLLEHPSNAVKLAAAAYLIKTDAKEDGIVVLRYLKENDPTLIAATAWAVLRFNNINLSPPSPLPTLGGSRPR